MTNGNKGTGSFGPVRVLSRTRTHDGFCKVDVLDIVQRRRDGTDAHLTREIHHHGNAVALLPVDRRRGKVLLVRQLRLPSLIEHGNGFLLEACAGLIDAGEDAASAAVREMEEEIGFRPRNLRFIGAMISSPGILGERVSMFIADYDDTQSTEAGGGHAEEGEDIEVVELACASLPEMIADGRIEDAKTLILIQHLMIHSPELFR